MNKNRLRRNLAIGVFACVHLLIVFLVYVLYIPVNYLTPWPLRQKALRWYRRFSSHYARLVAFLAAGLIIRTKVVVHGKLRQFGVNERVVFLSNHASNIGLPDAVAFKMRHILGHMLFVGKIQIVKARKYKYLLGNPLKFTDSIIPVDRRNRLQALRSIKEYCARSFVGGTAITLYAEGTRKTKNSYEQGHAARERDGHPSLRECMPHTPPPRSRGMLEIAAATRDNPPVLVTLAFSYDRQDSGIMNVGEMLGSTLHIFVREYTPPLPQTKSEADEFVIEAYTWINACIGQALASKE
jgi:1-acyl-sn-glycerol-3-phosphate acyltransferase